MELQRFATVEEGLRAMAGRKSRQNTGVEVIEVSDDEYNQAGQGSPA